VITGSCVSTKQENAFFKLKVANFVAISGNRGAQQEFSVSIAATK